MESPELKIALLAATFAFSFIILAYEDYADHRGWPVGEWLRSKTSLIRIWGVMGLLAAPVAALFIFPLWTVIIVPLAGFFSGYVATRLLKTHIQIVAVVALPLCWVVDILYVLP